MVPVLNDQFFKYFQQAHELLIKCPRMSAWLNERTSSGHSSSPLNCGTVELTSSGLRAYWYEGSLEKTLKENGIDDPKEWGRLQVAWNLSQVSSSFMIFVARRAGQGRGLTGGIPNVLLGKPDISGGPIHEILEFFGFKELTLWHNILHPEGPAFILGCQTHRVSKAIRENQIKWINDSNTQISEA